MFNSNVLEVGVGLIFTFLAVSLITGAIIEAITSIIGWRANTLKNGIKALLNDPGFNGLARDLYAHASVNPRGPGTTAAETQAALRTAAAAATKTQRALAAQEDIDCLERLKQDGCEIVEAEAVDRARFVAGESP